MQFVNCQTCIVTLDYLDWYDHIFGGLKNSFGRACCSCGTSFAATIQSTKETTSGSIVAPQQREEPKYRYYLSISEQTIAILCHIRICHVICSERPWAQLQIHMAYEYFPYGRYRPWLQVDKERRAKQGLPRWLSYSCCTLIFRAGNSSSSHPTSAPPSSTTPSMEMSKKNSSGRKHRA